MRGENRLGFLTLGSEIRNDILVPRYYDPRIDARLVQLSRTHELISLETLVSTKQLRHTQGNYINKLYYGTGDVPYIRTSDIANWELKGSPKHGISPSILVELREQQNIAPGDILVVHEGTYLIGTPCYLTEYDTRIVIQHHLAHLKVLPGATISAPLLMAALLAPCVQAQIRARQFTADVIDSIVGRLPEVLLPLPKRESERRRVSQEAERIFVGRAEGRIRLSQIARGMDAALRNGPGALEKQVAAGPKGSHGVVGFLGNKTSAASFTLTSSDVRNDVLIPRYYDPSIDYELGRFRARCDLKSVQELIDEGMLELSTGDEVGKLAYGSGDISFIRTSDFGNWELKYDPKQRIAKDVYDAYASKQSARAGDILLVRDGTYLIGTSVMVTEADLPLLFSGGIYRIRCLKPERLPSSVVLAILNGEIVQRQIRNKQFTRDVIDTLGHRLREVILPIPKSLAEVRWIAETMEGELAQRGILRAQAEQLGKGLEWTEDAG